MQQKSNWITFIGPPNVGKSTLVNQLVGDKISIVTPKAQTTRNALHGINLIGDTQLVFTDTPGIFTAHTAADKLMVKAAWYSLQSADEICLMVDAKHALLPKTAEVIQQLKSKKLTCNLIINKIDKIAKPNLLHITHELSKLCSFKNVFMISALTRDGLDDLIKYFLSTAHISPWLFSPGDITNSSLRFMASEIVREKVFFNTHQELPYTTEVVTEKWEDKEHITVINIGIMVKTESHKKIIIGKGGAVLKKIGMQARTDIERLIDKKAFLDLHVKVLPINKVHDNS